MLAETCASTLWEPAHATDDDALLSGARFFAIAVDSSRPLPPYGRAAGW
jgi:hypothetical protein